MPEQKNIQSATNHQTKENVLNQIEEIEHNFKISINTEKNLRETRTIAAMTKPEVFVQIVKNNSTIRARIGPPGWRGEPGTKQQKNERTAEWTTQ